MKINIERLMGHMEISAGIGGLEAGGICRLALTDEDKEMRDVFIKWLKELDLQVRVDDFGNIYGRKEGTTVGAPAILIGSHLDTQPEGGKYDGILGVLAGLEVLATLHDQEITLSHPIELVCFTNEEGARFEPPLLGSGGLSERFSKEFVYARTDSQGKTFESELNRIGYQGLPENRCRNMKSYLELHIEQGPILDYKALDIGIVTGIQGMNWLEVTVTGESDHAGPTPMSMRKDALTMSVDMIQAMTAIVVEENKEATITVGRMEVLPNSINSIPGEVTFSIDIRHSNHAVKEQLTTLIVEKINEIAANGGLEVEVHKIWEAEGVHFSPELIETISKNTEKLGYSSQQIISGAGHDAKYMNEIVPTSMIFVPSKDGKSHCKEEFTSQAAIEKGANLLLHTVIDVAGGK